MTPEEKDLFGGDAASAGDALQEPSGGYGNQRQYVSRVMPAAELRQHEVEKELRKAFRRYIETRPIEVIIFERIPATDLAKAILEHPVILKPLLAACNLAGRALKRDLKIDNIDTYEPTLTNAQANAVAGYLLSFLPQFIELPSLSRIDRVSFIDKEIRKDKGRWEKLVCDALNQFGRSPFKKRKFEAGGQTFELDAATPAKGAVQIGIDIKRIEARQDIHQICDRLAGNSERLKSLFSRAKYGVLLYLPDPILRINVASRLRLPSIDGVFFTSDDADFAVRLLLAKLNPRS